LLLVTAAVAAPACTSRAEPPAGATKSFTGSKACESCHQNIYQRWKDTLMANVIQDPTSRPNAIIGDLSVPNPLVSFRKEDVAFTYGSKWKQRYFTKRGDDYFVFPAQWDVRAKTWRRYYVEPNTDWWAEYYPADQMQRPTGPLCDGCHSVNYDIKAKTVTEWNVGCEKCHGAGSLHVQYPVASTIVNPARLDAVRADDVCIQCHAGTATTALGGVYYDWPVITAGDRQDVWMLRASLARKIHPWPRRAKNRMRGTTSKPDGGRAALHHHASITKYEAALRRPSDEVCWQCHGRSSTGLGAVGLPTRRERSEPVRGMPYVAHRATVGRGSRHCLAPFPGND
jgi:hypothetical protein